MDEKSILRNQLFEKYFELDDGILLDDFVKIMNPINEVWNSFHKILLNNVNSYNPYSSFELLKVAEKNYSKYLIIKVRFRNYIVIDLDLNKLIGNEEIKDIFNEQFFIDNFKEMKVESRFEFTKRYHFMDDVKNVQEIVDFYFINKDILNLPCEIYYKIKIGKAWTYIYVNLSSSRAQLGFETPDQYLYEQLFLNSDLTPVGMQDATQRIGYERMLEMFDRIKDIKIPKCCIPEELYKTYLSLKENEQVLTRKKEEE